MLAHSIVHGRAPACPPAVHAHARHHSPRHQAREHPVHQGQHVPQAGRWAGGRAGGTLVGEGAAGCRRRQACSLRQDGEQGGPQMPPACRHGPHTGPPPSLTSRADFGLAIDLREERAVTRAGTLDYMAPEVGAGAGGRAGRAGRPSRLPACRRSSRQQVQTRSHACTASALPGSAE